MNINNLTVFCGSSHGTGDEFMKMAGKLGKQLAESGRTLVYGGAQVGCMGAVADAALTGGGEVIGVIPEKLKNVEVAHTTLTKLHVVKDMHARKAKMADLADGFVALPGGVGTLEEWFEVFTWSHLGYHQKPCGLLNVNGFFDPLISMLEHTIAKGFMNETYWDAVIIAETPEELLTKMEAFQPIKKVKWS